MFLGLAVVVVSAALTMANSYRSHPAPLVKKDIPRVAKKTNPKAALYHFTGKHSLARLKLASTKHNWPSLPIGDLIGVIGLRFLGTPYVNYTLDHSADKEYSVVNLHELDCVTFVESTLALARSVKLGEKTPLDVSAEVEKIRYRQGKLDGFCSRLHYLTDWFYDNEQKGLIKNVTQKLPGAEVLEKHVKLMSSRPQQYLQLRKHPELVPIIAKDEKDMWARTMYYLPKASVETDEQYLQTGDVIAITTSADILDCAHTGLCYRDEKGVLRFLHASQKHKKVFLDEELAVYLSHMRAFTGIIVGRPVEPTPANPI